MRRWNRQLIFAIVTVLAVPTIADAQMQTSTSYSMNESQVGGNGLFNATSTGGNYTIDPATGNDGGESLGAATVGNSSSASYSTNSGFDTTNEPGLTFTVNTSSISLGALSSSVPTTSTATFSVRDYTSSGYSVTMAGTPPTYHGHPLAALSSDALYSTGTEQYGVNFVSDPLVNGSPLAGSANPTCRAAGFCSGVAGDGHTLLYGSTRPYTIPNEFRFNSGDIVASGPKSSGETDYTMSIMASISTLTPAGTYQGSMVLITTGSY